MAAEKSRIENTEELAELDKLCTIKGCGRSMKRADDSVSLKVFLVVIISMMGFIGTITAYGLGRLSNLDSSIGTEKYDRLAQRQEVTREFTNKIDSVNAKIDSMMQELRDNRVRK